MDIQGYIVSEREREREGMEKTQKGKHRKTGSICENYIIGRKERKKKEKERNDERKKRRKKKITKERKK